MCSVCPCSVVSLDCELGDTELITVLSKYTINMCVCGMDDQSYIPTTKELSVSHTRTLALVHTHVHTCTHMYTHVHTCSHMYTNNFEELSWEMNSTWYYVNQKYVRRITSFRPSDCYYFYEYKCTPLTTVFSVTICRLVAMKRCPHLVCMLTKGLNCKCCTWGSPYFNIAHHLCLFPCIRSPQEAALVPRACWLPCFAHCL